MCTPIGLLALLGTALAVEPTFVPELQFRPRHEVDTGRDGVAGSGNVPFVTHRARLGASWVGPGFQARVVFQDVRAWGEELDTRRDDDGDGIDLAIGTFAWRPSDALAITIGRDEVRLHDERLVARANWRQPGRHFDGARATWSSGAWAAELAGFLVIDGDAFAFDATDEVVPDRGDQTLSWARGDLETDAATVQAVVVLDDRRETQGNEVLRATPGLFMKGASGITGGHVEAYGQLGTLAGGRETVRAVMLALRTYVAPQLSGRPSFGLGYDLLSGDRAADDGFATSFDTLRGANHRCYGNIDIAYVQRGGRFDAQGLHDGYLRLEVQSVEGLTVRLDAHLFAPAAVQSPSAQWSAIEPDLRLQYQVDQAVTLWSGASAWAEGANPWRAPEFWGWMMLDVAIAGPRVGRPAVAPRPRTHP